MTEEVNLTNAINYEQFLKIKEDLLIKNPSLLNLSNNNLYEYFPFSNLKEEIQKFDENGFNYHKNKKVHRCHLVEDWLRFYAVDLSYKEFIGFSNGVKHSFDLISNLDDFKFKKWLIPDDVYPFYNKTLSKRFTPTAYYSTLKEYTIPFYYQDVISDDHVFHEADVILITLPLKPLGTSGSKSGLINLKNLISNHKDKTFMIDCVYLNPIKNNITSNIENNSHENISYLLELYELGNVFLLTSLSKTWSMPNIMGITFIPKQYSYIREEFKQLTSNEEALKLAYLALNHYQLIPNFISLCFKELRDNLDIFWQNKFHYGFFKNLDIGKKHFDNIVLQDSYLYYIDMEPELFLEENILVIPASVFGGTSGSIISILSKDLENIKSMFHNC